MQCVLAKSWSENLESPLASLINVMVYTVFAIGSRSPKMDSSELVTAFQIIPPGPYLTNYNQGIGRFQMINDWLGGLKVK